MEGAAKTNGKKAPAAKPPSYADLQEAAHAKAKILARAFEEAGKKSASPAQVSEAKKAMGRIARIEDWINGHARDFVTIPKTAEEISSEKKRLCVALYVLQTLKEIRAEAERRGDYASYSLFLSAAKSAEEALSVDLFLSNADWDLLQRFVKLQPALEACSIAFGISSLEIQEVQDKFSFPLARLSEEMKTKGI